MHKLSRLVRFSINPFLPEDNSGFNSFVSRPAGEGLSIFFELTVALVGEVEPATGLVVNVSDIDEKVQEYVVPIFARQIRKDFRQGQHIGLVGITKLLKSAWGQLADKLGPAKLKELSLAMNPFRKVAIDGEDCKMSYFSEKFEFAATHKLWNDNFSDERNRKVFGKCANPAGHGHNYVVEVTIKNQADKGSFSIGDFERVVDGEFVKLVDHKNLNVDVPHFTKVIPTVENIAAFAWEKLVGKFGETVLHCVTVWETDKTCCSYYGQ
jgi:6-pyruvoyltetrahydropterin/6-carboxytetrahydropterin synthase